MSADNPLLGTTIHCAICQCDEELHWDREINERLAKNNNCFKCDFWREKIGWRERGNPKAAVIEGVHYMVEPKVTDSTPRHWLGFGGQRCVVRFHDGREVETNNLWCQGTVPERFREALPDNASFVLDLAGSSKSRD